MTSTTRFSVSAPLTSAIAEEMRGVPVSLFLETKRVFANATRSAQREVVSGIRSGPLYRRTGALARSIQTEVIGSDIGTLSASLFSANPGGEKAVVYAPIHELGGTVKAKNKYMGVPGGPYLNIPLPANKTAAGVTRRSARTVFASGGTLARAGTRWFVIGKPTTKSKRIVPMFILVKQVVIPARLGMLSTATSYLPDILAGIRQAKLTEGG